MTAFAAQFLRELLAVFLEASPYILFGFAIAACVHVLLPVQTVQRLLGRGRIRSVLLASLLGIPLPLCSCAVVPTALALRKRGASKGATVSFLVSTPETGEEAIALTWGLIDPLMALFRPIAALLTAITAGLAVEALGDEKPSKAAAAIPLETPPEPVPPTPAADEHGHVHDLPGPPDAPEKLSIPTKLRRGFHDAFVELFDETSHWMLAGLVISALISVLLPASVVTRYLSSGPVPLVLMLLIGIPLYVCASASTPIAAALMMKGLSPGAAFVFLLVGPATNIGSIGILSRTLGRRVTVITVTCIAIMALACGVLLDVLYPVFGLNPRPQIGQASELSRWIAWPSVVVFCALLVISFRRAAPPAEFRAVGGAIARAFDRLGLRLDRRFLSGVALLGVAWWLLGSCVVEVPPGNRALVRRFGKPVGGVRGEGVLLKLPAPFERADVFAADAMRRIELGFRSGALSATASAAAAAPTDSVPSVDSRSLEEEAVYLTGDGNLVSMKTVVQYRVTDPERYVYGFRDPENVLKLATLSEAVDILAGYGIDLVYGGERGEVEAKILSGLQRRVAALALGVEVTRYGILDVHAPAEVHAAFRDVASAHEDKQTAINVALRYLDETVNLAHGEAASQVEAARSDSGSAVLRADGESGSLKLRQAAFRAHRVGTKRRLYLEAVEEVLARTRKIIRPAWKGSGGIDLWIMNGATPAAVSDVIRGGDVRAKQDQKGGAEPPSQTEE